MRIFQVLEDSTNAAVSGNRTWRRNLYEPLVEMGHEVILFPAEEGRLAMQRNDAQARATFSQKLLDTFRREHKQKPFALFFAYLKDGMLEPAAIDEIRKSGVPSCNFSCNNTHQFDLVDELSLHFDYNLHSEKDAAQKFREIGAAPIWFPMAANPTYYHPYDIPRNLDVSFVGLCYARRPNYLLHLLENGLTVHAFGPEWLPKPGKTKLRSLARWLRRMYLLMNAIAAPSGRKKYELTAHIAWLDGIDYLRLKYPDNLHYPITDDEMIKKYSESKISLGFLEVFDAHNPAAIVKQHLHLREFEAPMSGALYLTGWCEEINEFYEPEKEILTYRNEHEMVDKIRFYLGHPEQAEIIRVAGRERALRDHTYHKRFAYLFSQIGLNG